MFLSLFVWIVLGVFIGLLATRFVDTRGDSPIIGIASAAAGALLFGLGYRLLSGNGDTWSILGLIFAAIGAALGAAAFHLVRARSINRDRQTVRSSY